MDIPAIEAAILARLNDLDWETRLVAAKALMSRKPLEVKLGLANALIDFFGKGIWEQIEKLLKELKPTEPGVQLKLVEALKS